VRGGAAVGVGSASRGGTAVSRRGGDRRHARIKNAAAPHVCRYAQQACRWGVALHAISPAGQAGGSSEPSI